jgi:hypothetical protein
MALEKKEKKAMNKSPEILGRSTTKSCVAGSIVHVQRRRPQRRGERAGHVAGSADSTSAASDGRVKGLVLEAAAVGGGGQGRRGGGGRGGRRLGRGHELRFHRLS